MAAYLIGEDGPHTGSIISLDEGTSWILGRDPDLCFFALEDPMVSRKHALITLRDGLYFIQNESATNPVIVNETPIEEAYQLQENDSIQIGNSFFRFTEILSDEMLHKESPIIKETKEEPLSQLPFIMEKEGRWMLKVISGPNQGAEFVMDPRQTHIIGKDPTVSDIIFQDLSVSRQHAKLELTEAGEAFISDLGSRNGVFVNGVKIEEPYQLSSQDLIHVGTTSFLIIDRKASQETIYSPGIVTGEEKKEKTELPLAEEVLEEETEKVGKKFHDLFIPTKHLIVAGMFGLLVFVGVISFFALFHTSSVVVAHKDESKEIKETLKNFPSVQFSYNASTGKVFLIGHVLTDVEHSELLYLLKTLPFITNIEDNIVVDEGVWESMNALLVKNPNWRGVMVSSTKPGKFVIRGYLPSEEEAIQLQDYLNLNFPYLNLLDNQVVVENTLQTQVQNMLIEEGFVNVTFQFVNGELIFAGRVNSHQEKEFNHLLAHIGEIRGVRQMRNFVIFTSESTARIDLTSRYNVMGTSRYGDINQYVLINGKILSTGEMLDGMVITSITPSEIQLDKDGIKYKIDYNQQ